MKLGLFAGIGALAAALLVQSGANAATYVENDNGTTFIVQQNSPTDFSFEIIDAPANWSTAKYVGSFGFDGSTLFPGSGKSTGDTLTAKFEPSGPSVGSTGSQGISSSGAGCSGNGNLFCWDFGTNVAVTTGALVFDISITGGSTPFSFASGGPDLKVNFVEGDGTTLTNDHYSATIPLCGTRGAGSCPAPGVPEPAPWAMMIIGLGAIGAAMRMRRNVALAAV